jgi:hypothetical protein
MLAVGSPLIAILTALAMSAIFECTRTYRIEPLPKSFEYISESAIYYGFAPLPLLPLTTLAGYLAGVASDRRPDVAPWILLGAVMPLLLTWISVIRLTYTVKEGAMGPTIRAVLLVPLSWIALGGLWAACVGVLFSILTNLF